MERVKELEHRIFGNVVINFVIHQTISTVGSMLLGFVVVLIPAVFIALFAQAPNGFSFVDKVVGQPLFKLGTDNPYFIGPVLMAFILGWISRRSLESRAAAWVWVLPTLALVWNMMTWKSHSSLPRWADVEANFFTANCGDSDCIYELFLAAPFYTSVAYSLSWFLKNLITAT
jgi:hypothetical protein